MDLATHPTAITGMSNPSLVLTPDHQLKIQNTPVVEPGPGEVLVHIRVTGICGSDLHLWRHGRIGALEINGDCILGHEAAGIIAKLGHGVEGLKEGDRVAIEPGVPCRNCFLCTSGRYNLCEKVAFAGVYPHQGTMQRYKVHPAKYVHRLPDFMSLTSAALLEPLSVAIHALRETPVRFGMPVAVFGAGPIGLLAMAVARASGAHPIVITDIDESRLDFAMTFEPHCRTHQVQPTAAPEDTAKRIRDEFENVGWRRTADARSEENMPALVLECTGVESSITTAAYTVQRGGSVNVLGLSALPTINNFPFLHLSMAEIRMHFTNRYSHTWPAALRALEGMLMDGKKLDSMVTHRVNLERADEAMEFAGGVPSPTQNGPVIKVQVVDAS